MASADLASNGRLILGIRGGWEAEEMEDRGTIFKSRWELLLERIKAMKALWTVDEASYHGEFVSFNPVWCWPKPVHKAHPPILVGSYGPRGCSERSDTVTPGYPTPDLMYLAEKTEKF